MGHRVVLYTKEGCCLCDRAKQVLGRLKDEYALEIEEVDITRDAALMEQYGQIIPVVVIDGRHRFESKIAEHYLRRALDGEVRPAGRGPRGWWPWGKA